MKSEQLGYIYDVRGTKQAQFSTKEGKTGVETFLRENGQFVV